EPEVARPLLQHARLLLLPGDVRTLPGRQNRKGGLLAAARRQEQSRHDDRQSRLDGSGGEPARDLPASPPGRVHDTLPQHQYLYRHLLQRWFGVDPRERAPDPDSASAALRIGHLRRPAPPDYARSIAARL